MKIAKKKLEEELKDILDFWLLESFDNEFGGFRDYVDAEGHVISDQKGGWLQGRSLYIYTLAAKYFNSNEYENVARQTAEFVMNRCISKEGRVFFRYSREGDGLILRRYLFAEVFAAMGLFAYGWTFNDAEAVSTAKRLLLTIETMKNFMQPKHNPEFLKLKGHSMTMILINLYQVFREFSPNSEKRVWTDKINLQIRELFDFFIKRETLLIMESVLEDGSILNTPEGRTINPGHGIETCWFLMEEAEFQNDPKLLREVLQVFDSTVDFGWDNRYGGLFSFLDYKGHTPNQVEWSMKYWWPHNELVYAAALAFKLTGDKKYEKLFKKSYRYTMKKFPDRKNGEWFGYLSREGKVVLDHKGNHFKGIFHIPRMYLKLLEL
ncbi:MAG: AGE family epimerase/isomerase [Spirochaetales bacterium]|nr:AGE family epimerase/isomerase [Spirochaetales bacterium]